MYVSYLSASVSLSAKWASSSVNWGSFSLLDCEQWFWTFCLIKCHDTGFRVSTWVSLGTTWYIRKRKTHSCCTGWFCPHWTWNHASLQPCKTVGRAGRASGECPMAQLTYRPLHLHPHLWGCSWTEFPKQTLKQMLECTQHIWKGISVRNTYTDNGLAVHDTRTLNHHLCLQLRKSYHNLCSNLPNGQAWSISASCPNFCSHVQRRKTNVLS